MEIKQQFDSWEVVEDLSPFELAEMFGNIGGFWGKKSQQKAFEGTGKSASSFETGRQSDTGLRV